MPAILASGTAYIAVPGIYANCDMETACLRGHHRSVLMQALCRCLESEQVNNRRNYYRILHVQPDAPVEIIKSSYRTLMQRLKQHPDLGGDHWNAALINEAYRALTNTESREHYDREQELARRTTSRAEPKEKSEDESTDRSAGDSTTDNTAGSTKLCRFCRMPHGRRTINDRDAICPSCASPLCPAEEWNLESNGQRAVNRVPKHFDIIVQTSCQHTSTSKGSTVDISPNGMQFISSNRIRERSLIKITSDVIDAVGLVTHCRQDNGANRWTIGVAFETLRLARSQGAFISTEA